jgi:hypothetical protein
MYPGQMMMFTFLVVVMAIFLTASTGGTFNMTVGVTEVVQVEQHYGAPSYTYMGVWDGYPCVVYVYPHWGFTRYIYTYGGFVIHVEDGQ